MSTSVACPSCGFESPPGFRFCGGCGTSLEAPASSVVAVPEEAGPEAERRQLTVMFCDLVGSTTLSGQLEPEEWREILRHYQDLCHRVIARYDGHIAQYLGDGILAYFGYPRAHEDAAQRAIHSGLEIIGELDGLNQILAAQNDLRLQVRLGIDTGEVVTGEVGAGGRTERLALGQTPNIAARLQGLAKPDTVVLSGATHQLAQGFFVCESLGEVRLKGVERSVEAHRAIETSGVRSRFEVTAHRDLAPLVGREEEVRRLKTILEELGEGPFAHGRGRNR